MHEMPRGLDSGNQKLPPQGQSKLLELPHEASFARPLSPLHRSPYSNLLTSPLASSVDKWPALMHVVEQKPEHNQSARYPYNPSK
jgi:hypothetical protein